jgi:PAS domain S-box-containing protein
MTPFNKLPSRSILVFIGLVGLGLFGNWLSLPLFFGVDFLFGGIFALTAAALFGPWRGALAGAMIGAWTLVLWHHPWALVIFTAEAAFVGWFCRRGRENVPLIEAIYWGVLGIPLVGLFYGWHLNFRGTDLMLVMLKQSLNGVFNAVVAGMLAIAIGRWLAGEQTRPSARLSLRYAAFLVVCVLTLAPICALTVMDSRRAIGEIERSVLDRLERSGRNLRNNLEARLDQQYFVLRSLAERAEASAEDYPIVEERLALMLQLYSEVQAAEAVVDGQLVAHAQRNPMSDSGIELAAALSSLETSDLANALLSLGHGPDANYVIVRPSDSGIAIAAVISNFSFIQGELRALEEHGALQFALMNPEGLPILTPEHGPAYGGKRSVATGFSRTSRIFVLGPSEESGLPAMSRWSRSHYAKELSLGDGFPWTLIVSTPTEPFQQQLYLVYVENLSIAVALTVLALFIASMLGILISRPFSELGGASTDLPRRVMAGEPIDWPRTRILEVDMLISNFGAMIESLKVNIRSLRGRTAEMEREALNRKAIQSALQRREREVKTLVENAPDIIARYDRDLRHVYVNRAVESHTGLPVSAFFGRTIRELGLLGDGGELWERQMQRALESGREVTAEFSIETGQGRRYFQARIVPEVGSDGRSESLLSIARDVTLRREAERFIASQREVLEMIATQAPLGSTLSAVTKIIEERFPGVLAMVSMPNAQGDRLMLEAGSSLPPGLRENWEINGIEISPTSICCGRTAFTNQAVITPDVSRDPHWEPARESLARYGLEACWSIPIRRSDGKVLGVLTCFLCQPQSPSPEHLEVAEVSAHLCGIAIERRRHETALADAQRQLRRYADELEARVAERTAIAERRAAQLRGLARELTETEQRERRRLAQLLHDHLQQLLVVAKLRLGGIRSQAPTSKVGASIKQVEDLVDEAISSSRSLTVELSPPILYDAGLGAALEWLGRRMLERHELHVEIDVDPDAEPDSDTTRVLLFQAAQELLFNVVKHARTNQASVHLRADDDDWIELEVADQGVGCSTVDSGEGGRETYGLFSLRERLEASGGAFSMASAPGQGCQVTLRVPRHDQRYRRRRISDTAEDSPSPYLTGSVQQNDIAHSDPIRVVLADDHHILREGLAGLLEEESDIQVVGEAGDGEEAVELVRRLRPDVVIMDVTMPALNGVDATRLIARDFPEVRIIGLSMHGEESMSLAMKEAGAVAYFTKGGPSDPLIAAIRDRAAQPY